MFFTISKKPCLLFLLSIPILIIYGIYNKEQTLDINIHDTYYIIEYLHLTIIISILFGFIGLGYWIMEVTNKNLSNKLIHNHVWLTFVGTLFIWVLNKLYSDNFMDFEYNNMIGFAKTIIVLLIIFIQIIFPINILYGLFKGKHK